MLSTQPTVKPIFKLSRKPVNLGFTLMELIIAAGLTTLVLAAAGTGLVTLLNANQAAEQRQGQRQELERAMAFISDDIRAAQRVNQDVANQTVEASIALADAQRHYGNASVPYFDSIAGTPALYLEIPVGVCNGNPVIDRVTYEVRRKRDFELDDSLTVNERMWRGPYLIYRHGRIPRLDGGINACREPVISEVLVDGILSINTSDAPSCGMTASGIRNIGSAIRSGLGGFYTCVEGTQVALLLRGNANPNPAPEQTIPLTLMMMVHQRSISVPSSRSVLCTVPDLVGRRNAVAKSMVTESKLVHNSISDPSLSISRDLVASQLPAPNARLPCGQIVTFTYRP